MRLLNPALLLRNIMTPGPADQKESEAYFTAREPGRRLSERDGRARLRDRAARASRSR